MALSYMNVYLGTDEEGTELKARIKAWAEAHGFHSASEFCRWAITEKLAESEQKGGSRGPTARTQS